MYTYITKAKLSDTDAAGILFFGNYFKLVHEAYEEFMDAIGFPLPTVLAEGDFLILITHAQARYTQPVRYGEQLTIHLTVEELRTTSFSLRYLVKNRQGKTVAELNTVHVTVDKMTMKKTPLPDDLRGALTEATA